MTSDVPPSDADAGADEFELGRHRSASDRLFVALGLAISFELDTAMADAGFGERRFPDGRVLRLCSGQAGSTISAIGRELGITRQGASKVVAHLRDRGYVAVADSATSRREKSVILTSRGIDYLRGAASGGSGDRGRVEGRTWRGGLLRPVHLARRTRPR